MTAETAMSTSESDQFARATPDQRRATIVGWVLISIGLFVFWAFGVNVDSDLDATEKAFLAQTEDRQTGQCFHDL